MRLREIYIRDPYVLFYNNKYYMYGKRELEQKGFVVYTSDDMINWEEAKEVFSANDDFWGEFDFWAPEVHLYQDKFYLIASFKSKNRRRGSQIFVSDSPIGEFKPLTKYAITPEYWDCLDGTLYVDRNENPHLVFCHEWEQGGVGEVCEIELSKDLSNVKSEPKILWKADDSDIIVDAFSDIESKVTDGPFFYRLGNGELVCFWSSFSKNGYTVLISRSDNGDIDGNWIIDEKPVYENNGGHGMVFKSKEGKNIFCIHSPNDVSCERAKMFEVIEKKRDITLKAI